MENLQTPSSEIKIKLCDFINTQKKWSRIMKNLYIKESTTFLPKGDQSHSIQEFDRCVEVLAKQAEIYLTQNKNIIARGVSFSDHSKRLFMCIVFSGSAFVDIDSVIKREDAVRAFRPSDFNNTDVELSSGNSAKEIREGIRKIFFNLPVLNFLGGNPILEG